MASERLIFMRLLTSLIALTCCTPSMIVPVLAQDATAPATSQAKPAEQLRNIWHKEQARRILIALLPDNDGGEIDKAQPSPQTVAQWLQENKQVARNFGGITAFAPSMRTVIPSTFGPPDFYDTGNPWQDKAIATPQFLASLSTAQWRQIASAQGLGNGSLSADQKALWELVVPNPFVFDRTVDSYTGREWDKENTRTLTDAERQQVRLRVKLIADAYAPMANRPGRFPVLFHKNQSERGRSGETFLDMREDRAYDAAGKNDESGSSVYGQPVTRVEPMRPKTLPASFEAKLSATPIALVEKPQTMGELLDAIEAVTGLKLYCDASFRSFSVAVLNSGSVAADDLLRALLFASDCTVRVLPPNRSGESPLYLIVQQIEPFGRTFGRKDDWQTAAESSLRNMQEDANAHIAEQDPLSLLQFDADDPLPLSGTLKERVFAAARHTINGRRDASLEAVKVPLAELPASAQKEIDARAKGIAEGSLAVRVEKVEVDCSPWLGYIAPGSGPLSGEIDGDPLVDLSSWLPPLEPETQTPDGKIVLLSAETTEEVQELAKAAHEARAKEIWVQGTPEIIAAAVSAAGDTPVRAVVSLLRIGANTPPTLPRDENIYGKVSREWLVPDAPEVASYATERVRKIAAIPGIAGIVLRDWVPLGYRGSNEEKPEQRVQTGESDGSYGGAGRAVGYTLARRRAYVLETGDDPADFIPVWGENSPGDQWHMWVRKQILPLWSALREAVGNQSVLLEGEATFRSAHRANYAGIETFVPWDTKEPEPSFVALFRRSASAAPNLRETPLAFAVVAGNPNATLAPDELTRLLKRSDKPETTIWDLSDKRIPGVAERLRNLKGSRHTAANKDVP